MNEPRDGTRVRLDRLEGDYRDISERVRTNERALAGLPYLKEDWEDIKRDCAKTREWVEQKIREQREAEAEEKRLSAAQWAAIIGGIFILLAAIVQLVGVLVGATG